MRVQRQRGVEPFARGGGIALRLRNHPRVKQHCRVLRLQAQRLVGVAARLGQLAGFEQRPCQRVGGFDAWAARIGRPRQRHRRARIRAVIGVEQGQLQVGVDAVRLEELLHGAHQIVLPGGVGGFATGLVQLAQANHKLGQGHARNCLLVQADRLVVLALCGAHMCQPSLRIDIVGQYFQRAVVLPLGGGEVALVEEQIAKLHTHPGAVLGGRAAGLHRSLHHLHRAIHVAVQLTRIRDAAK